MRTQQFSRSGRTPKAKPVGDPRIGLLTAPGLAKICLQELELMGIKYSNPNILHLRNHDLILITLATREVRKTSRLRTVDDVFFIIESERALASHGALNALRKTQLKDPILQGIALKFDTRRSTKRTTNYWVFVKQDRDSAVFRKQIAQALVENIAREFSKWKAREPADIELWAFMCNERLTYGLRLSDAAFRKRRYKVDERAGALRPTIAAAMAVLAMRDLSSPAKVLDPMCGSGTILIEAAALNGHCTCLGIDIDESAVELAKLNTRQARLDERIEFLHGDSTDQDSGVFESARQPAEKFDCIISNLPFGVKFKPADLQQLYNSALKIWKLQLSPSGRMILLVADGALLLKEAKKVGLKARTICTLRVLGRLAIVTELYL